MTTIRVLFVTFLIALGIVMWDEVSNNGRFPHPDRIMHVMWAWILLGIAAEIGLDLPAAALGVGFDLAMAYTFMAGTGPISNEQQLKHHDSPAAAIAPTGTGPTYSI